MKKKATTAPPSLSYQQKEELAQRLARAVEGDDDDRAAKLLVLLGDELNVHCQDFSYIEELGRMIREQAFLTLPESHEAERSFAAEQRAQFFEKGGKAAMEDIGILPQYRGTCVHDGWLSYTFYPKSRHALCGAHLLRELVYFEELGEEMKGWAGGLKELLLEIKTEVEKVSTDGGQRLAAEKLAALTGSYDRLIAEGLKAPPSSHVPEQVRAFRVGECPLRNVASPSLCSRPPASVSLP